MDNAQGESLIMGMIHTSDVVILSSISIVPRDLLRLMLLFHGDFEFDGWDSLSNARHFEIDNGLTTASRTSSDHGLWRNCFAQRALGDLGCTARYEWRLKCKRRQHREYAEDAADDVVLGL